MPTSTWHACSHPAHPLRRRMGTHGQVPHHLHPPFCCPASCTYKPPPARLGCEAVTGLVRRTERLNLRLTKSQRARIEERAGAAGLTMSEYVVQSGCGDIEPAAASAQRPEPDDFEARVREYQKTMPRRSAEIAVRREEAAARAKAALASA